MANCRKCGNPLVIKDGKCVYCGESVQGSALASGKIEKKESFVKAATKSLLSKDNTWPQGILRTAVISIIVSMVLGILILFIKAWPGWFISVYMLSLSVVLTIFSFIIINADKGDDKNKLVRQNLRHGLNIILLWGAFFFIIGVVCIFINWWAVMIVELLGIAGIVIAVVGVKKNKLGFMKS